MVEGALMGFSKETDFAGEFPKRMALGFQFSKDGARRDGKWWGRKKKIPGKLRADWRKREQEVTGHLKTKGGDGKTLQGEKGFWSKGGKNGCP